MKSFFLRWIKKLILSTVEEDIRRNGRLPRLIENYMYTWHQNNSTLRRLIKEAK